MNRNRILLIIIIAIIAVVAVIIVIAGISGRSKQNVSTAGTQTNPQVNTQVTPIVSDTPAQSPVSNTQNQPSPIISTGNLLVAPIDRPTERATLKLLGTYITPKNSPVHPEKFTGFHTGVDFETFPDEADKDVAIVAVCNGPLLVKRTAQGYGGVAVQRCEIDKQLVTIIYGHMRLASMKSNVGDTLTAGQQLGVLGTGYSAETDGERKHLHLGIHKGSSVELAGYVQNKSKLSDWLDILKYL